MTVFSLVGFANHLRGVNHALTGGQKKALERAALIIEKEAKAEIGNRQGEAKPFKAWDPLADTTIHGWRGHPGKEDLGFTPPDYDPLLRGGDMRDSIEHTVKGHEAHVGSNSDVAVWQELGTVNMPARSFLGGAAVRKKHEVGKVVGRSVAMILSGRSVLNDIKIP